LRGERQVEAALLDQAVHELNRLHARKGLEHKVAVGTYVKTTFFGGDYGAYRRKEKKHVTYRQLGKREDLDMSFGAIQQCVAVTEQIKDLPDDLAWALSFSQHRALFSVIPMEEKVALARAAVEECLTVVALQERVARHQDEVGAGGLGRPRLRIEVKKFNRLETAVAEIETDAIAEELLVHVAKARIVGLARKMEGVVGRLDEACGRE